jgi:predicted ester cyclase
LIPADLATFYRSYIACLNAQDWANLGTFVDEAAVHNGRSIGLDGYRAMLVRDFETIPDLLFAIDLLACDPPLVAARLAFDCHPAGDFLGLPVNGRRVAFTENVLYAVREGRIREVWSILDKQAVEAALG